MRLIISRLSRHWSPLFGQNSWKLCQSFLIISMNDKMELSLSEQNGYDIIRKSQDAVRKVTSRTRLLSVNSSTPSKPKHSSIASTTSVTSISSTKSELLIPPRHSNQDKNHLQQVNQQIKIPLASRRIGKDVVLLRLILFSICFCCPIWIFYTLTLILCANFNIFGSILIGFCSFLSCLFLKMVWNPLNQSSVCPCRMWDWSFVRKCFCVSVFVCFINLSLWFNISTLDILYISNRW